LLDAISKNVPVPYAGLFAPMVAELFLDSYYQVDLSTRSKMEEMLMTWRDGGQHGREVFGVVPQVAIERAIWQSSSSRRAPVSPHLNGNVPSPTFIPDTSAKLGI
jgi:pre-mRNA cleavage complex 2 protein Pcf11